MSSSSIRPCPACQSPHSHFKYLLRDHLFRTAKGEFSYQQCQDCKSLFIDPLPTDAEIQSYYHDEYWWSKEGASVSWVKRLERRYREWIIMDHLRFLPPRIPSNKKGALKLLDVGCGSGALLMTASRRGYMVTGVDFSIRAVENLRGLGVPCHLATPKEIDVGEKQFDIVSLFHVLEHLAEPNRDLRSILRLGCPQATFIIQVPLLDSIQARLFGARWYGLDPPRHLIQFTFRGLCALLQNVGLQIEKSWYFSLRDNPAAIASSLFPFLDPMSRRVINAKGECKRGSVLDGMLSFFYFFLVLLSTPFALMEAGLKKGGTIILRARIINPGG